MFTHRLPPMLLPTLGRARISMSVARASTSARNQPFYQLAIRPKTVNTILGTAYNPALIPAGVRRLPVSLTRTLHTSTVRLKQIPFLLADVGEGITECEIIKW